jgi:aspartyl-tRNA(Asn)/glutamyl-tRNA(Gln) amidotransferase subunit B
MDYRYFPDPDLLPLDITSDDIARIRASMPELPEAMRERFMRDHALPAYDARLITASKATARFFEDLLTEGVDAKLAANWINGELASALNRDDRTIIESPISARSLSRLLARVRDGSLSSKMAKEVFGYMWAGEQGGDADAIIAARSMQQVSDAGAIEKIVDDVIAANQKSVDEFKSGKEKAFQALVGQVMKVSKGTANPAQVNDILKRKLSGG